jgi:hypothetical protein
LGGQHAPFWGGHFTPELGGQHQRVFQLNHDLVRIENANHTFGSQHPWNTKELPDELREICDKTSEFL